MYHSHDLRKIRAERNERIKTAVSAGMSVREIAEEFGLSKVYVYKLLHDMGIFRRREFAYVHRTADRDGQ